MNDLSSPENLINVIPVVETMPADLLTPLGVYLKLSKEMSHSFLLESVEGGEKLARYSFIGSAPEFIATGDVRQTNIQREGGQEVIDIPLMSFLRDHFTVRAAASDSELPPFIGGAIGYLGFECAAWFNPSLQNGSEGGSADAAFMFYRSIVAFDHAKQVIKIISLVFSSEGDVDERIKAAEENNRTIKGRLNESPIEFPASTENAIDSEPVSNWARGDFKSTVDQIKEHIRAGECYQAVLSQRFSKRTNASAVSIYRALRSLNPSPYMFLLQFDGKAIVGASPEMLVRCEGGHLEYRPIAGTRPRGKTPDEDIALADEMKLDTKEVAEHLMLVDLGRNDLGRVAEYGSVSVDTLMSVEKYSHVQHLVSSLSATLRNGFDRFDALAACFPAGTVSGAPKVRAIEVIRELEPGPRGIYAGAVGYFDYTGNLDTCIAIRTLVLEKGLAHIQAGAGIVADSVPAAEFEETVNKARGLFRAVEIAESGQA